MDGSDMVAFVDSEGCNVAKKNWQRGHKKIPDPRSAQKVINLSSMQHEVKLHKAESVWKHSHKDNNKAKSAETLKTEKLYKKARSILNKLTPQKFQTLVKQMSFLEISSEEELKGVANLVFEKAIAEPGFSVAYASMCRYLTQIKVPSTSKPGEVVNFRAILLTRCQKEFEKDKDAEGEIEKLRVTMKEETQEEKIAVMKEEIELAEANNRQRYLGNIRFIGELFKLKMLTEPIMHECIFKLLNNKDEESLECLCQLLKTIGKELDTDRAKQRIDQYFQRMNKLVEEKKTSPRVRFMMQDVIDLRSSNWVPRRDENNPKTIKQIHKEARQEEQAKMLKLQTVPVQLQSGKWFEIEEKEVKKIIKKTIAILDEYRHMLDIKEVITCVKKLRRSSSAIHLFVVVCINQTLERSNQERRHTALLLHDLVKKSIITDKQYLEGLKSALQYAEDKELDIPKIWQYFAELIEPMVQDGSVPLSSLKEACTALKKGSKAGLLVAEILRVASGRKGHTKVGILWRDSGLQWSDFVAEDQVEAFLKEKKLDFTVTDSSQASAPTAQLDDKTTPDKISQ